MSDQHSGAEGTSGEFGDYPFDPPPSGFEERRSSGLAWLPMILGCGAVVAILVLGAMLLFLRSGSANDGLATGQPSTNPIPAEPDPAGAPSSATTVPPSSATTSATSATTSATAATTSTASALSSTTALTTTSVVAGTETSTDSGGAGAAVAYPNPAVGSGPAGSGCGPATGTLPDGLWFGRMQRAPDAPNDGFWGDDKIQLLVYCLYGGEAATQLAAQRLDEMRPDLDFYVIRDDTVRRTISRSADAQARELLDITGAVGQAVPWDQGLAELGSLTGEGCCTEGWARIEGEEVVEIAVIHEGGFTYSFPRPRGSQCADNGLDVNPLLMDVGSVPDDSQNGELPLYTGPGYATEYVGSVPIGGFLNVVHRCEIAANGYGWWMLDWDGRAVWGPGEFLVPRN